MHAITVARKGIPFEPYIMMKCCQGNDHALSPPSCDTEKVEVVQRAANLKGGKKKNVILLLPFLSKPSSRPPYQMYEEEYSSPIVCRNKISQPARLINWQLIQVYSSGVRAWFNLLGSSHRWRVGSVVWVAFGASCMMQSQNDNDENI